MPSDDRIVLMAIPYRDICELVRGVLSELGIHRVVEVTDSDAAWAKLGESETWALVIADWSLEPRGGLTLLQQVRASPEFRDVRVVILSALADLDTVVAAKTASADDFIMKPFSLATLKRKLGVLLGVS